MPTIKPSEGVSHARKTVFVEGEIAGLKFYSEAHGGRWVVKIRDSGTNNPVANLALNENLEENLPVQAMGVGNPNSGILQLFSEKEFGSLFKEGRTFRAEAIVGTVDGMAWFNVWQIILFEPEFKIGTRQVFNEPTCERRVLLQTRRVEGLKRQNEGNLGGVFIGNLVGSTFQDMVVSSRRNELFNQFAENPKKFLREAIQSDDLLKGAMGQIGETQRLDGNEWKTAKNQITKLIESPSVQQQIEASDQWETEVPVSSGTIDGNIDLRTYETIIELKSGIHRRSQNDQVYVYLVGEMLKHGFAIKSERKGVLVTSSLQVDEDNRVTILQDQDRLEEMLRRFLLARHRLLIASSGERLPKINYEPAYCKSERCPFYFSEGDTGQSACHFYCQTDRNWDCAGCKHATKCTEHSKYHPFEILDESNRIRSALKREIESVRDGKTVYSEWSSKFTVSNVGDQRLLTLNNPSGFSVDPPKPGEKILIQTADEASPVRGQMCGLSEDGDWIIINRGPRLGTDREGSEITVSQPKSELNGIYNLQGCLDELQRLGEVSNREGVSFAGGSIVSGRPQIIENFADVISEDTVTDIFYQSFSVTKSKKILQQVEQAVMNQERLLIVTDAVMKPTEGYIDLRGDQLLRQVAASHSIPAALTSVKETLEQAKIWVISPDMFLNDSVFDALPQQGEKYFDRTILYEANNVTGLEYFLIREFSKRMIVIGDGNCVGRPLHSSESIQLGLGDNLMTRVYNRGFPEVEGKCEARIVLHDDQEIDHQLNQGLEACRMIKALHTDESSKIQLIACESEGGENAENQLIHSCAREIPGVRRMELKFETTVQCSPGEIEQDLSELINIDEIQNTLIGGQSLSAPTSGREYKIRTAPTNPSDEGQGWVIKFYGQRPSNRVSDQETVEVVKKAKELREAGVKMKNLAIMSTSHAQLDAIAQQLGDVLKGVNLRTPYGISGESWGHVIVSCAAQTAQDIDVRELYTMIRASHEKTYIFANSQILQNHPLFRNIQCKV
ncbi:hypothetical protein N8703_02865 [Verrucomicrobia bacterium]|nr:hypothetical protein [Verrucomicrobiota bacterium]